MKKNIKQNIEKEKIKPEVYKVLKRIQDSIPPEWLKNLVKTVPQSPTIKKAYEMAVKDPNVSEELKRKAQVILDTGMLDKEVEVVQKKYETLINNFIEKELEAAVKRGEIPKGKKFRNVDKKIRKAIIKDRKK